jgi:hypothetical protein
VVGVELAKVTEQVRQIQRDALAAHFGGRNMPGHDLSAGALVVVTAGIPKMLNLEKGIGISTDHTDVVDAFAAFVELVEPPKSPRPGKRKVRAKT